jgi:hypothetical protein
MNEAQRSRDSTCSRRRESPIAVLELGASDRAAQHLHLVTKHDVLELQLRHGPASDE